MVTAGDRVEDISVDSPAYKEARRRVGDTHDQVKI